MESKQENKKYQFLDVIHPDKTFRFIMEIFSIVLIIEQAVEIPMMIFFEDIPESSEYDLFSQFINVYFWVIMLMQFNIGIYDKRVLIQDRTLIAKAYLKGWFTFDLIANFPFETIILANIEGNQSGANLKLLKLTKMIRIIRLIRAVKIQKTFK
jgi:hypothetical protein